MNINLQTGNNVFLRNLSMQRSGGLKSEKEKIERQAKRDNEIAFWENQKQNLKNTQSGSLEDIARKLEMFHSYEDMIAAAKDKYNSEQIWHVMDEAKERAEKIAESLEKYEPKTAEERLEDMAEEAVETDGDKGAMTEALENMAENMEELQEESLKELEESVEASIEKSMEETLKKLEEEPVDQLSEGISGEYYGSMDSEEVQNGEQLAGLLPPEEEMQERFLYERVDIRI